MMDRQLGTYDSEATRSDSVVVAVDDAAIPNGRLLTHDRSIPSSEDKGLDRWGDLKLAYKTLGVVFGGLVTSPLYVYPSMPLKSPTEEDYLGIYSIMFWTLTLIGVVKYACIALKADDQGEGGTFALYSLLCRNFDIGILPSKHVISKSSVSHANVYGGFEKKNRLGIFLEKSLIARRLLLFIAMLGMCMLIGDGILTPAISVLSAMDGIRAPFPSVSKALVDALSAIVLIVLFLLLQKYGSEALFADLGHFNRSSIQIAFLFTIYPSLVLTYAGQTAYLIKNPYDHDDGFYKFIPRAVYWPIFVIATLAAIVASQSLISATFSVIKQSVVLDYFPRASRWCTHPPAKRARFTPLKSITSSWYSVLLSSLFSAMGKILEMPLVLLQRKIEYELTHKIGVDRLRILLSDPTVQRVPGLCFFYTNQHPRWLDPNSWTLHKEHEVSSQGVYGCVLQYGYADSLNLLGDDFVSQVTDSLRAHIENSSGLVPSVPLEVEEEISDMEEAKVAGVVHIRGKTRFFIGKNCSWFDRFMLAFYEVLHNNCRTALPAMVVPIPQRIEVGMLYEA
ncbi:K+ uptake permease 10 [Actinidia rufa]|uniref:K+ uptake permease 10 n=1 Tax=Actinidia rufa TaxID=165716 RepID=A0A7J0HE24_9ERIC|nr:K+ uptake permease 10 [Actinidia rufa]